MKSIEALAARVAIGAPLVAAVILLPVVTGNATGLSQGDSRSVVLVSIDGLRPDYVTEADRLGLQIPNLRRLLHEGAHATGVRGVIPTVTYPSHATLVTGVAPARHGIHSNTTFDPLQKNQGGWYWYASDITSKTLWDAAAERRLTVANVHWPVTVGARIDWNIPQYWRTGTPDDRKLVKALSTKGLLDSLESDLGPYADGIDESIDGDERRARFVLQLLKTRRPSLMLAYFTALDHAQHDHGPFSIEARATLERIDRIVGDLWQRAVDASGGRAVMALVSDHGFVDTRKSVNLGVAFAREGLLTLGSDQKPATWKAMPWGAGGSAAIVLADATDSNMHRKVSELLNRLAADSANGIERVLDGAALRTEGAFPDATFYVAFKPGFTAGAGTTGELVTPSTVRGMHGHLNTLPEMRASFFIVGSGIPKGQALGEIDMRDIAPTLAAILGVSLPKAEGRNLVGRGW
jgi:predicted AlkP superfamily pyrophosphatase or phosphodiesterase